MTASLEFLPTIVFVAVMLCWFTFAGTLLFRKPIPARESERESGSLFGLALQGLAFAVLGAVRRQSFTPPFRVSRPFEIAIAIVTVALAVVSIWLAMTAVRTLGKEWSVTARLLEGHKLATKGPYRFVRHPIYTAVFGMLLATGLAISHWPALVIAVFVCAIGTWMRIRSEEKLLRGAFGPEFEAYARSVPALMPRLFNSERKAF